jgi:hypothetical protein
MNGERVGWEDENLNSIMDKETKSSKNPGFRILPSDIPF